VERSQLSFFTMTLFWFRKPWATSDWRLV